MRRSATFVLLASTLTSTLVAVPAVAQESPPEVTQRTVGQEVAALRTEYSSSVFLGREDSSVEGEPSTVEYATTHSTFPVHLMDETGAWSPIDVGLAQRSDGRFEPRATPFALTLAAEAHDPHLASLTLGEGSVSWALEGARPGAATVDAQHEGALLYRSALPHVDMRISTRPNGVKEELILQSAAAPDTYRFPLERVGTEAELTSGGSVVLTEIGGDEALVIPPGWMMDSSDVDGSGDGEISPGVTYSLEQDAVGATVLEMTLDREWLDDPERVYPVVVDPSTTYKSTTDPQASHDTFYTQGDDADYRSWPYVGAGRFSALNQQRYRGAVLFGTPGSYWGRMTPGTGAHPIDDADLRLYQYGADDRFASIQARVATSRWDHNGALGYPGPGTSSPYGNPENASEPNPTGWVRFDVDAIVSDWEFQTRSNYGFVVLDPTDSSNSFRKFRSEDYSSSSVRPQLYVRWINTVPDAPYSMSPSNGYTGSVSSLSARYDDNDGDDGHLAFKLFRWTGSSWILQGQNLTVGPLGSNDLGTWSVGTLSPGSYKYEVWAYDMSDEDDVKASGTPTTVTFTVPDTQAPAAPTVSLTSTTSPYGWVNDRTVSFSWTEPYDQSGISRYHYGFNTSSTTTITSGYASTTSRSRTETASTDGTWWMHVAAMDGASNLGATGHRAVNIDTVNPGTPTALSSSHPSESTWYPNADLAASWSASDDRSGIWGYRVAWDGSPTTTPTGSITTSTSGTWTAPSDGIWYLHVRAVDRAGNESQNVEHRAFRVDTQADGGLTAWSTSHPNDDATVEPDEYVADPSADFAWSWTDDQSGIYQFEHWLDGGAPQTTSSTTATYSDLGSGTHTFSIRGQDNAGNWTTPPVDVVVGVDLDPPTLTAWSPSHPADPSPPDQNPFWYSNDTPSFEWSATDALSQPDGYRWQLTASPTPPTLTSPARPDTGEDYPDVPDGTWYLHVQAKDGAGNWSEFETVRVNIDTTGPSITSQSTSHPLTFSWYSEPDAQVSWEATDARGVQDYRFAFDQQSTRDFETDPAPIVTSPTSTSITGLTDGIWYFHVQARDTVGNWGPVHTRAIRVDTTAPGTPTVNSSTNPDPDVCYSIARPRFTHPASDGPSGVAGYSYTTALASGASPDGSIDVVSSVTTLPTQPDGARWFSVRAVDRAGNVGPVAERKYVVDTTAPISPRP